MGLEARLSAANAGEGFFAAVLGALARPVLAIGPADEILFANGAAEEFFGIADAHIRRRSLAHLAPHAGPLVALVKRLRAAGGTLHEFAVDLSRPLQSERTADVLGSELAEWPGACILVFEPKGVAERLGEHARKSAARQVSGMAAVLAHEIKNPLAGIKGAAQLIEAQIAEGDRPLARLIASEADRVAQLIDRMTAFGDAPPARRPVNIHDVLDHVHRLAASSFAKNVAIAEDYDPSLPPVRGDRDALVQIVLNLVRNAAEAVEREASPVIRLVTAYRPGVRVKSRSGGDALALPLEIDVVDNGPGIPADLVPHIFEPFVTTKRSGSGLGLAIVAKLVEDHGGLVECRSRPGETVFRLRFPVAMEEAP